MRTLIAVLFSAAYLVCLWMTNAHGDTALLAAVFLGPLAGSSIAVAHLKGIQRF